MPGSRRGLRRVWIRARGPGLRPGSRHERSTPKSSRSPTPSGWRLQRRDHPRPRLHGHYARAAGEAYALIREALTNPGDIFPADRQLPARPDPLTAPRRSPPTSDGGAVTDHYQVARIALTLITLEVRDDAWARMKPDHREAHIRLWTDLTRHAQPGYVAAPASLLAFAWQAGDGALGNLAIDPALADDHGYSVAWLIRDALSHGLPPSAAVLSMTPDEVAASYQAQRHSQ